MKRWLISIVMLLMLSVIGAGSLALAQQYPPGPPPPSYTIEVQPPALPPLRFEVRGTAPSPDYVWVPGYWNWNGHEYMWMSGKWMELPTPEATWVPGHWEQTKSGWAWISGYWSR